MKKRLLLAKKVLAGVACLAVSVTSWAAAPTLYGVKCYAEEGAASGLYSVEAVEGAQPQLVWADGDMIASGGVVYCDGTLYVLTYLSFFGDYFWGYQTCDPEAQTYDYTYPEGLNVITDVAATTAYDPTSSTAYAVCLADETGKKFNLCTIDLSNGKKTPVATLPQRIFTLSFTAAGQLYGIGADGVLYKIDKYTGALTSVGSTGLIPSVNECAVIDYETNIMYWHATTGNNGGSIYTVDLATGKAELLTKFSPSYQLYGLYIKQKAQSDKAPAAPENLVPEFDGAALEGFLNFTLPTLDIEGGNLTGNVDWKVTLDGKVLSSGAGAPGSAVAASVSVPAAGRYRFVAEVSSAGHDGLAANSQLWVGMDTPCSVTDIELSSDKHTVFVSWTLPERGVNGGYVDHSKVRYILDRGPENVLVVDEYDKTEFSETLEGRSGIYPVLYRITPYIDDLCGQPVISTYVLAGEPYVTPFTIDLTDPFNSLIFDIVDNNHDRATWFYDSDRSAMSCMWPISSDRCRDDWMISFPMKLDAGEDYLMSVGMKSEGMWSLEDQDYNDVFAGEFAAYIGSDNTPSAMTENIMEKKDVESAEWYTRISRPFSVKESGEYYIGFHVTGTREVRNIYNILLRSMTVESAASISNVDTAASGFSAIAADGAVLISNPQGADVQVYTPSGALAATTSAASAAISLSRGIYIVTCGNSSVKVAVR